MGIQIPLSFDCLNGFVNLISLGFTKYAYKEELFVDADALDIAIDNILEENLPAKIGCDTDETFNIDEHNSFQMTNIDFQKTDIKIEMEKDEVTDKMKLEDKEKYQCNECNEVHCDEKSLKKHTKIHIKTDAKLFECSLCAKNFRE